MREFIFRANIAGCIDPRVAGLQKIVDRDAGLGVIADARSLEIETFDVGRAADADQDLIGGDRLLIAVTDEISQLLTTVHSYPGCVGVEMNLDAVARESLGKKLRRIALF